MATPKGHPKASTQELLDAQHEGYRAAWQGHTPRVCPYVGPDNPVKDSERAALLRDAWSAGWAAAATDLRARHDH